MILKNKNILITGAGKGIGLHTLKEAISEGAFVFAVVRSRNDSKKFKGIKNLKVYYGDVSNKKLISKIFKYSNKINKTINGLVNNAGIRQRKKFNLLKVSEVQNIFKINYFSIFQIMQIFSKNLIKKKSPGSVINIGSIVGQLGFSELSGYASTKLALTGLTKSFATEMASKKIRANIISPGFTKTSFYKKFKKNKKLYNWTLNRIPLQRWGNPEEVSNLICFLLSDKASYITGENINIDGGWSSS